MMDTASEPGAWAVALPFCQNIAVSDFNPLAYEMDRRLATRRANRKSEPNPHKRGHMTRALDAQVRG